MHIIRDIKIIACGQKHNKDEVDKKIKLSLTYNKVFIIYMNVKKPLL